MSSAANGRVLRRARTIAAASNARSLSVVEALAMLAAQLRGCNALGRRCCSGAAERGGSLLTLETLISAKSSRAAPKPQPCFS
jgi:hypothetical protein